MGHTEWAMWANEQGVITSFILILGGILGVAGEFKKYQIGAYSIVLGVLVLLVEYPRGKRRQGTKTVQRSYQRGLTYMVGSLGVIGSNYYIRFVFYLLACVPCGFFLATILGGFSLFFTSVIYLRAAVSGEKWLPCLDKQTKRRPDNDLTRPPTVPPPRKPYAQGTENLAHSADSFDRI